MSSNTPPPTAPEPAPNPGAQQQQQGLPPTGLQQQLASLNNFYQQSQQQQGGGYNAQLGQFQGTPQTAAAELPQQGSQIGGSSLESMARNLAQRYGMPIGRGRMVDEYGNFLMTPQQIADASGGSVTLGEAASQMNYISQAITRRQNEEQQQKGMAALQTGLGQVQSRGRGSLAGMMSGFYQDIADMYANQEYEAADFSYYIQKEQLDIQRELQRRQEKMQKRAGRGQLFAGIGLTIAGIASGNPELAAQGGANVVGGAATSGWFD